MIFRIINPEHGSELLKYPCFAWWDFTQKANERKEKALSKENGIFFLLLWRNFLACYHATFFYTKCIIKNIHVLVGGILRKKQMREKKALSTENGKWERIEQSKTRPGHQCCRNLEKD